MVDAKDNNCQYTKEGSDRVAYFGKEVLYTGDNTWLAKVGSFSPVAALTS